MWGCGPAKHWSPPRSHTFPHQSPTARLGVFFGLYRIHRCIPHFGSTTSPLTPPLRRFPRPLRLRRLLCMRVVPLPFCVVFAGSSADLMRSMANAITALMLLFTRLPRGMYQFWCSSMKIQAP